MLCWCSSVAGFAQHRGKPDEKKKTTSRVRQKADPGKSQKIFLDEIEILGKIEKPQAIFILPGKDPIIDDIHIDRSFFKEIFRPVEFDIIGKEREFKDAIKKTP